MSPSDIDLGVVVRGKFTICSSIAVVVPEVDGLNSAAIGSSYICRGGAVIGHDACDCLGNGICNFSSGVAAGCRGAC